MSLLIWVLSIAAIAAADPEYPLSIQAEVGRLESSLARGKLTEANRVRLAEIYFLTSRCDDARRIHAPISSSIPCACGGECVKGSVVQRASLVQKLYSKGAKWNDVRVQRLWQSAKNVPEARYWAVKILTEPRHAGLRWELEKSLAALEVNP